MCALEADKCVCGLASAAERLMWSIVRTAPCQSDGLGVEVPVVYSCPLMALLDHNWRI